jgi:hypothetical protein
MYSMVLFQSLGKTVRYKLSRQVPLILKVLVKITRNRNVGQECGRESNSGTDRRITAERINCEDMIEDRRGQERPAVSDCAARPEGFQIDHWTRMGCQARSGATT